MGVALFLLFAICSCFFCCCLLLFVGCCLSLLCCLLYFMLFVVCCISCCLLFASCCSLFVGCCCHCGRCCFRCPCHTCFVLHLVALTCAAFDVGSLLLKIRFEFPWLHKVAVGRTLETLSSNVFNLPVMYKDLFKLPAISMVSFWVPSCSLGSQKWRVIPIVAFITPPKSKMKYQQPR